MPLRAFVLLHLLVFGVMAAEQPSDPMPIPPERHEAISRQMIDLQRAQMAIYATQYALDKAKQAEAAEEARYDQMLKSLRAEFHAEGCEITADKKWSCTQGQWKPVGDAIPAKDLQSPLKAKDK